MEEYTEKNLAEDEHTLRDVIRITTTQVSDEAIDALEAVSTTWRCGKREAIVHQDEVCDRWIFVAKGLHRLMYVKNGKEDTLFFDGGGAVFTSFHGIQTGEKGVFRLEAINECHGWSIRHEDYEAVVKRYPELMKFELRLLRHQIYCLEEYYRKFAKSTPQERYTAFWKQWPKVMIGKNQRTTNMLSRYIPLNVIAQYLSMTPQMLSRCRRREMDEARKK